MEINLIRQNIISAQIPIFQTSASKYEWLNHTVAIGTGKLTHDGVIYAVYAVK